MAGPWIVDDGGNNTTGADWANAYTSINSLDTAVAFASSEIVYFGHDSVCQATNSANLTITGPASGLPVKFISVTQGTTDYAQATANQIDTTEGAYSVTFSGSFALHGIKVASGAGINFNPGGGAYCISEGCIFAPAANGQISFGENRFASKLFAKNPIIDLSADGTTNRTNSVVVINRANAEINGATFVNAAYRTGTVVSVAGVLESADLIGCDFSGFTNATTCEILNLASLNGALNFANCKTAATWTPTTGTAATGGRYKFVNCGSADQPVSLIAGDSRGALVSTADIYRTGGGTVEGTANALLITTTASCSPETPFCTDWFYNTLSTTGSKTWKAYIVNDTADLNDNEAWLEIQYKATASSGQWTTVMDKPATITTAAAAQTDDTTSTWNGTGPSFTYMQELSVTATVNTTGQWRGRICFGKASVSAASNLYLDPDISVS